MRAPLWLWGCWMFFVWRWRLGYWDVDALRACLGKGGAK